MAQNTPIQDFFAAIQAGSVETVKQILIKNEVDGKMLNHPYVHISPAAHAAQVGNCEILQLLLDHGADINFGGKRGQLPLYLAARRNHLEVAKVCIKAGAVIDRQHVNGNTALLEAAKCGHVEIVRELLKCGSNPHIFNNGGDSALHMAAFDGNLPLVELLLEAGLPPDLEKMEGQLRKVPTGVRPLHLTCLGDNHEVAALLISKGASVNALMNSGRSALHTAAGKNSLKTATLLIQHGCHVNVMDESHKTALTSAIDANHCQMVELLISAGADVDTRDKWGTPALINAAYHDRIDIMLALIRGGSNVNAVTNNGITPIGACLRQPFRWKMACLLAKAGSRILTQDLEKVILEPEIQNYEMIIAPHSLQVLCRHSIGFCIRTSSESNTLSTDGMSSHPTDNSADKCYKHHKAIMENNYYTNCLTRLLLPPKLKSFLQFEDLNEFIEATS